MHIKWKWIHAQLHTCIIAAGPELMPIRKSSGSLSYGGSSYQWPIWCGRIDPLAASSYIYVSSTVEVEEKKKHREYLNKFILFNRIKCEWIWDEIQIAYKYYNILNLLFGLLLESDFQAFSWCLFRIIFYSQTVCRVCVCVMHFLYPIVVWIFIVHPTLTFQPE